MKAHARKKAAAGPGVRQAGVKAQSTSRVAKLPVTEPKAGSGSQREAPGSGAQLQSSAHAESGTRKRGAKPRAGRQAGRKAKDRTVAPSGRAAVRFPIVGIGASAGGLDACKHLLQELPPDTGMGFVLVQHLDPAHASALTQLLARSTLMPVREVSNNTPVQPNHVYVIPPNTAMSIAHGNLKLHRRQETSGGVRSIDFFFESLAQDQRERAIGVILSGTATDGTLGLEAIKAEAGITFAQDETAKYDSMPRSAIAAGCVDFVLSPENIAKELVNIARHPCVVAGAPCPPEELDEQARALSEATPLGGGTNGLKRLLLLVRNHSGVDFSLYKANTIRRRINRRMVLSKLTSLESYARSLRGNAKELDVLFSDLLISVTSFFRNPDAFEVVKRTVFPALMDQRRNDILRVWVLGCSTGQEAYSLAMIYRELAERSPRAAPALQVFATDLNQSLLDKARAGFYPKSLVHEVSPERRRRFFVEEDGGYRVSKLIREMVVFARQNILSDPPFSRIDLLSCRNLLIYLEPSLQKKVLPMFHYALRPKGFLFLGASESTGSFGELFEPVDRKHKIYRRESATTPALTLHFAARHPATKKEILTPKPPQAGPGSPVDINSQREADRVALNRFAPAGVLVNAELQVLQFRGDTGPYLKMPSGKASFNILKMAREGLLAPLRSLLKKAKLGAKEARREKVRVSQNGWIRTVNLEIIALKNIEQSCFLIFFQETSDAGGPPAGVGEGKAAPGPSSDILKSSPGPRALLKEGVGARRALAGAQRRMGELERELAETRDYLQSIEEQNEAVNEEIQASSEEIASANEELQSTNEELETSKEELESANEELTTVNEEMANRNILLHQLNSDLINLQRSLHLSIVLFKRDLTIHRFNAEAEKQFNLLASDVGRPLGGLRHNLDVADLDEFIAGVIESVREAEREVRDKDGRWYSLRVRPYLTLDNKVDGAVLVLVDIDAYKRTEQAISEARAYAETVIRTVPDPLVVLNADFRVHSANEAFYNTFQTSPAETEGRSLFELGHGQWNTPKLRALVEDLVPRNNSFNDFEIANDFERIGRRVFLLNARLLKDLEGRARRILLGIQDMTERKQAEAALAEAKQKLEHHAQQLEKTVAERTAALRETVSELESFSYSISHDLRGPLRAMTNFAQILRDTYTAQLDETGRDYLQRISGSASRLDRLVQDVLNYTRILRAQVPLTRVDLDKLVREIVHSYPDWQPPQVDIQIEGTLPPVLGHEGFLTQCVANLLNNAVKFVAPGVQPRVRIWAEPGESHVRLNFQDNGVGIETEDETRIFRMFERIHPAHEYEGTGIGLTIVRKAVERMGGQVDFESEPGKGSKFWLELQKSDSA